MKLFFIVALFFITVITITSCKKESAGLIVGKWSIVKDYSYLADSPPFFNAGSGSTYIGTENDYYDFAADGNLYIREGSYSDTLTYKISGGDQLIFIYPTYNTILDSLNNIISQEHPTKSYTIQNLSANTLTISSNLDFNILTPVGYMANRLELKK